MPTSDSLYYRVNKEKKDDFYLDGNASFCHTAPMTLIAKVFQSLQTMTAHVIAVALVLLSLFSAVHVHHCHGATDVCTHHQETCCHAAEEVCHHETTLACAPLMQEVQSLQRVQPPAVPTLTPPQVHCATSISLVRLAPSTSPPRVASDYLAYSSRLYPRT